MKRILVVEDDLVLQGAIKLVLEWEGYRVSCAADGQEALNQLRCGNRPDVILLDLNLPRKDGREVLEEIKADEHLRRIPVVVLTSSAEEQDIVASYELNANCYITKPVDFEQFMRVVRSIEDFWLTVVKLPRGD